MQSCLFNIASHRPLILLDECDTLRVQARCGRDIASRQPRGRGGAPSIPIALAKTIAHSRSAKRSHAARACRLPVLTFRHVDIAAGRFCRPSFRWYGRLGLENLSSALNERGPNLSGLPVHLTLIGRYAREPLLIGTKLNAKIHAESVPPDLNRFYGHRNRPACCPRQVGPRQEGLRSRSAALVPGGDEVAKSQKGGGVHDRQNQPNITSLSRRHAQDQGAA